MCIINNRFLLSLFCRYNNFINFKNVKKEKKILTCRSLFSYKTFKNIFPLIKYFLMLFITTINPPSRFKGHIERNKKKKGKTRLKNEKKHLICEQYDQFFGVTMEVHLL